MSTSKGLRIPLFNEYTNQNSVFYSQCGQKMSPLSGKSGKDSMSSFSTQSSLENLDRKETKSSKNPSKKTYKLKQKTELCKTYSLGLVCPYGDACSFAHGVSELKSKSLVPAGYKTNKCRDFHNKGYCKFGLRCQFVHREHDVNNPKTLPKISYTKALETFELETKLKSSNVGALLDQGFNLSAYNLPRLSIFESLSYGRFS